MGIELVRKNSRHIDEFVTFDNKVYPKSEIPDDVLEEYALQRYNYITPQSEFVTDQGQVLVSDQTLIYFGQHLFYPARSINQLNANEQWLSAKKGLNDKVYAGYKFLSGEDHYLNSVTLMRRLGSYETPGKLGPSPKHITIQCIRTGSTEWEDLSTLQMPVLTFMSDGAIDYGNMIDIPATAFRVVIDEWYPGVEPDMFVGLYRLFFLTTPANFIRLPKLDTFNSDYVYAYRKNQKKELSLPKGEPEQQPAPQDTPQIQVSQSAGVDATPDRYLITPYTHIEQINLENIPESVLQVVSPDDDMRTMDIRINAPETGQIYIDTTYSSSTLHIQIRQKNQKRKKLTVNTITTGGVLLYFEQGELAKTHYLKRR